MQTCDSFMAAKTITLQLYLNISKLYIICIIIFYIENFHSLSLSAFVCGCFFFYQFYFGSHIYLYFMFVSCDMDNIFHWFVNVFDIIFVVGFLVKLKLVKFHNGWSCIYEHKMMREINLKK